MVKIPRLPPDEFGGEHGSGSQSFAALGTVRNGDQVGIRLVGNGMNPGNDAAAYGGDLQLGGLGRRTAYPFLFAGQVPENSFGQRDRRSARSILFLRVMGFFDRHVVFRKTLHQFGQSAVHREKHVDADAVIRSVEERALPLVAQLFDFGVPGRAIRSYRTPPARRLPGRLRYSEKRYGEW